MAFGDNSDDGVSTGSDQKWANINFKNLRHPDHGDGSDDMQRYFDDAEYVKEQFPSRTKIVGELISGVAQFHRSSNGSSIDRDDQDDLLKSVAYITTGKADVSALLEYVEERAEAAAAEAPADD